MNNCSCTPSGIDIVGDIQWGTHFCKLYETEQDILNIVVPYFIAGLQKNEYCLWVISDQAEKDSIIEAMQQSFPDVEDALRNRQIEFKNAGEMNLDNASDKNSKEVIEGFIRLEKEKLAAGYSGVRLAGDTTKYFDEDQWDQYIKFESKIDEGIQHLKVIALCCYSLKKRQTTAILDIIKTHGFALSMRNNQLEMIENSSIKLLKNELQRLNVHLESKILERTKELKMAVKAREDFLFFVSHELKMPLTSLRIYVDAMLQKQDFPDSTQVKEIFEKIQEKSIHIEKLINNLLCTNLEFKTDCFPIKATFEKADISSIIQEVVSRFEEDFRAADCTVSLKLDTIVGHWDPMRIDQIITNLLNNVIKHSFSPLIEITATEQDKHAIVTIRDLGIGISPDLRPHIFNLFMHAQNKTTANSHGIGLWMAREFVKEHKGEIKLIDQDSAGTCFEIRLPLIRKKGAFS